MEKKDIVEEMNNIKYNLKYWFLKGLDDFGLPYFNIKIEDVLANSGIRFNLYFSSVIFPSKEERINYPWDKIS